MREHWLQHAHGRIVAGDSEPDVLADYGWVQITAEEREALKTVIGGFGMWVAQNALTDDESLRLAVVTLGKRLRTLATHATPSEGSVQNGCTLTDAEREAVEWYANFPDGIHADTLRKLLERLTHDAVPEAKANADGEPAPKCGGEAGLSSRDGTGNTPSKAEIDALEYVVEEGRTASIDDYGILRSWLIRLRPEWESQSYEESNEKRTNTSTHRCIDRAAYEGDIVSRLRNWRGLHLAHSGELFEEAASEIERLRTLATHATPSEGSVPGEGTKPVPHQTCPHVRGTVTQHCSLNFTLTDAEREAIETAVRWLEPYPQVASTLRKLLERIGGER